MVVSSRNGLFLYTALLCAGCSVGGGEGSVTGTVNAPDCDLEMEDYSLEPTFFGSDTVDGQLEIRLQRGSDFEVFSDGLSILVRDAKLVRGELIGVPIELEANEEDLVQIVFYLNDTCPPGRRDPPVAYEAASGFIVFQNIYAPELTDDDVENAARFTDVLFVDPSEPETRNALLTGEFRFLHTRGRPAQRFP